MVLPLWYAQKCPKGWTKIEWQKIKIQIRHYVIIANHLYQRELDGVLHYCVYEIEIHDTFVACHNNICGDHFVGRLKTQNAL